MDEDQRTFVTMDELWIYHSQFAPCVEGFAFELTTALNATENDARTKALAELERFALHLDADAALSMSTLAAKQASVDALRAQLAALPSEEELNARVAAPLPAPSPPPTQTTLPTPTSTSLATGLAAARLTAALEQRRKFAEAEIAQLDAAASALDADLQLLGELQSSIEAKLTLLCGPPPSGASLASRLPAPHPGTGMPVTREPTISLLPRRSME
jgi:hypothetical protein